MKALPTVSVLVATYNSGHTIDECLSSVRAQRYPQSKIEIIIGDGGSIDGTIDIARKHKARIERISGSVQNAEYNRAVAAHRAKGDLLLILDHDNILPHPDWLLGMVEPILRHDDVVGVETLRYHYDPGASLLDRYFALFGAGDPLAFYLGKADRMPYLADGYTLSGQALDRGKYYLVTFRPDRIPTIGSNGFLVRRKLLFAQADVRLSRFFHIDVNVDLIRKGFSTYAFVKDTVMHKTSYNSISHFLYRRVLFVEQYHLGGQGLAMKQARRYSVYEPRDSFRLAYYILISLTFVVPLIDSLRGFLRIRDRAWFLHPILCFSLVFLYSWAVMKHQVYTYAKRLLAR